MIKIIHRFFSLFISMSDTVVSKNLNRSVKVKKAKLKITGRFSVKHIVW